MNGKRGIFLDFVKALMIVILGGTLTGFLTSIVSNLIYMTFLFPIGMGFVGGMLLLGSSRKLKIRGRMPEIITAILMAVLIYGTFHYTGYLTFRILLSSEMNKEIVSSTGESQAGVANIFVDYALEQETGHTGFTGYMLYKAEEGVSIGRWYSMNKTNLGPIGTWVYWFLELGLIGWVTAVMTRSPSSNVSKQI